MKNIELAKKYEDYIISMRRHFHENPEMSGEEFLTIGSISEELDFMGIKNVIIQKGGILATIKGKKDNGKAVMLRADVDALPVQETDDNLKPGMRKCKSKVDGLMHACGHDGHIAMLLGVAKILLEKKDELEGTVYLCFERGEELAGGIQNTFAYIQKNNIKIDSVYGTHLQATTPSGYVGINDSGMMAGAMWFTVEIEGVGGHGSRPDQANNPIDCFVAIYQRLQSLRLTKVNPFETCTYSIGEIQGAAQYNVIPQSITFSGTMRTFDCDGAGMEFYNSFKETIDGICAAYGCKANYKTFVKPSGAVVNDSELAAFARKAISDDIGADRVGTVEPWMASESFHHYLAQWPGVFAFVGIQNEEKGTGAAHHHPHFDIDEDALIYGAAASATYALEYLKTDGLKGGRKISHKDHLTNLERYAEVEEFYGE